MHDGCVEAQGYLFSKPRQAREVPGLIARLNAGTGRADRQVMDAA